MAVLKESWGAEIRLCHLLGADFQSLLNYFGDVIPNLKDSMTALSCFEQWGAISDARGGRTENTNTVVAAVGVVGAAPSRRCVGTGGPAEQR